MSMPSCSPMTFRMLSKAKAAPQPSLEELLQQKAELEALIEAQQA